MSVTQPFHQNGACLCGEVKIKAHLFRKHVTACHCRMCQAWGSFLAVQAKNVEFSGEDNITVYNSSDWAERGFCKCCGSHIYYRLKQGNYINFSVGLFNDVLFEFEQQIYIDKKPDFYAFSNKTENLTELEVHEKLQL